MRRTLTHSLALAAFVIGAVLAAVTPVRAQSTATIQGTITDSQGAVMPGVSPEPAAVSMLVVPPPGVPAPGACQRTTASVRPESATSR